jgi:hypothetical protein
MQPVGCTKVSEELPMLGSRSPRRCAAISASISRRRRREISCARLGRQTCHASGLATNHPGASSSGDSGNNSLPVRRRHGQWYHQAGAEMTMPNVAYFVGAGLTKSLETNGRPVPAMWDFTSTMADYLDDDIVLTTMAELENAGLYQHKSEEAARLAAKVVGESADRSPATRAAFREALKRRPRESIEDLLERSLWLSGNPAAAFAHQRFNATGARFGGVYSAKFGLWCQCQYR